MVIHIPVWYKNVSTITVTKQQRTSGQLIPVRYSMGYNWPEPSLYNRNEKFILHGIHGWRIERLFDAMMLDQFGRTVHDADACYGQRLGPFFIMITVRIEFHYPQINGQWLTFIRNRFGSSNCSVTPTDGFRQSCWYPSGVIIHSPIPRAQ